MPGTAALGDWPSWQGPAQDCMAVIPWPLQKGPQAGLAGVVQD